MIIIIDFVKKSFLKCIEDLDVDYSLSSQRCKADVLTPFHNLPKWRLEYLTVSNYVNSSNVYPEQYSPLYDRVRSFEDITIRLEPTEELCGVNCLCDFKFKIKNYVVDDPWTQLGQMQTKVSKLILVTRLWSVGKHYIDFESEIFSLTLPYDFDKSYYQLFKGSNSSIHSILNCSLSERLVEEINKVFNYDMCQDYILTLMGE